MIVKVVLVKQRKGTSCSRTMRWTVKRRVFTRSQRMNNRRVMKRVKRALTRIAKTPKNRQRKKSDQRPPRDKRCRATQRTKYLPSSANLLSEVCIQNS